MAEEIDEDHPIWKAIHRGGGQGGDVASVLRELKAAGFRIVAAVEPDIPFSKRILDIAKPADRPAIDMATGDLLDLIGSYYGLFRYRAGLACPPQHRQGAEWMGR